MTLSRITTQEGTDFTNVHNQSNLTNLNAMATAVDAKLADVGHGASSILLMGTKPTAGDTVTIGADVYEFGGVGSNINVTIGAAVANSRANLIEKINTYGTEKVVASATTVPSAGIRIQYADRVGGTAVVGASASIALSKSLSAGADVWCNANLNESGAAAYTYCTRGKFTCNATNIAAGSATVISLSFTPTKLKWTSRDATDDPKATTATVAISGNTIVITPGAGGTALIATDYIEWEVFG